MKTLLSALIILAATASLGAGGCTDTTGANEGTCVTAIRVTNDSVSNKTYEVIIDGVRVGALTPGGSDTFTVTPGNHLIEINFAAGGVACTPSAPAVAECQTYGLTCRA